MLHWPPARELLFCPKTRNYFTPIGLIIAMNSEFYKPNYWNPALEQMGAFRAIIGYIPLFSYRLICPMQGDQLKRLSQQQVIVAEAGIFDTPLFPAVRTDIVGSASYTSLMGGSFRPVESSYVQF